MEWIIALGALALTTFFGLSVRKAKKQGREDAEFEAKETDDEKANLIRERNRDKRLQPTDTSSDNRGNRD